MNLINSSVQFKYIGLSPSLHTKIRTKYAENDLKELNPYENFNCENPIAFQLNNNFDSFKYGNLK